jgi:hypothetical protein
MATKTYGNKKGKSVKGKLSSAFKKAVLGTIFAVAAASPLAYHWGTVQTAEVKVTDVKSVYLGYDSEKHTSKYDYTVVTDKGTFHNDNAGLTVLNLKENSADIQGKLRTGNTYDIQYYGISLPFTTMLAPNLLSARLLTEDELKARHDAAAANASPSPAASTQPAAGGGDTSTCLSGEVVTYNVVKNGYTIQITIPTEVVGQVSINTVKPVSAPAP